MFSIDDFQRRVPRIQEKKWNSQVYNILRHPLLPSCIFLQYIQIIYPLRTKENLNFYTKVHTHPTTLSDISENAHRITHFKLLLLQFAKRLQNFMQCRVNHFEHSVESCDFSPKYNIVSVKFLVFIFRPWGNLQRKWKVTKENKWEKIW